MKTKLLVALLLSAGVRFWVWNSSRTEDSLHCHALGRGQRLTVRGSPLSMGRGHWQLESVELWEKGRWRGYSGIVSVEPSAAERSANLGHRVRVSGPFRCAVAMRNPGVIQDGFLELESPRLQGFGPKFRWTRDEEPASLRSRFQTRFSKWLHERFATTPYLQAFVVAVWTGDPSLFPPEFLDFYTKAGLLQILALSGQHVACLVVLLSFALQWSAGFARGDWYRYATRFLPLFCATLLWMTSQGSESMKRSLAMITAMTFLQLRRMECSPIQLVASSAAILILWDPSMIASAGFFMSALSTALLVCTSSPGTAGRKFLRYAILSLLMPILVMPMTAFFFARAALAAPVVGFSLSWVWDLAILPMGFAAPFFPSHWLEPFLKKFVALHEPWLHAVSRFSITVPRPTWLEFLVLEWGLVLIVTLCFRRDLETI